MATSGATTGTTGSGTTTGSRTTTDTDTTSTSGSYNGSTSNLGCAGCLPRTDYRGHRLHRIRGEVREIDQKHHTLSMQSKDTTRPYKITKKTRYAPKGTSLDAIHVGDRVSISYVFSHRRRMAIRITVIGTGTK